MRCISYDNYWSFTSRQSLLQVSAKASISLVTTELHTEMYTWSSLQIVTTTLAIAKFWFLIAFLTVVLVIEAMDWVLLNEVHLLDGQDHDILPKREAKTVLYVLSIDVNARPMFKSRYFRDWLGLHRLEVEMNGQI